jgi:hypothetical protein
MFMLKLALIIGFVLATIWTISMAISAPKEQPQCEFDLN